MESYNGWDCYEDIPDGWRVDRTAGSPLHGYEFIINGKSVINGGKRALVRVYKESLRVCTEETKETGLQKTTTKPSVPSQIIDEHYCKTVNDLARKKFEMRLLADIRIDLMVCEIEGWNKLEYLDELKTLISSLGSRP